MNRSETALLLAKVASVDNRRLDPPDADVTNPLSTPIISAWHEILAGLRLADCAEALLAHRRNSTEWLNPAHIVQGVRAIRAERLEHQPPLGELMADIDGDDPRWNEILKQRRAAIASGTPVLHSVNA